MTLSIARLNRAYREKQDPKPSMSSGIAVGLALDVAFGASMSRRTEDGGTDPPTNDNERDKAQDDRDDPPPSNTN